MSDGAKQIEEIKNLADGIYSNCPACLLQGESEMIARYVVKTQDYRKASDVAREIIDIIDGWFMYCEKYSGHIIKSKLAELKNKIGGQV